MNPIEEYEQYKLNAAPVLEPLDEDELAGWLIAGMSILADKIDMPEDKLWEKFYQATLLANQIRKFFYAIHGETNLN